MFKVNIIRLAIIFISSQQLKVKKIQTVITTQQKHRSVFNIINILNESFYELLSLELCTLTIDQI